MKFPAGTMVDLVADVDENHLDGALAQVQQKPFWIERMHPGKTCLGFGPDDELFVDDDLFVEHVEE